MLTKTLPPAPAVLLPPPWSHIGGHTVVDYLGIPQEDVVRIANHLIADETGKATIVTDIGGVDLIVECFQADNRYADPIIRITSDHWKITFRWSNRSGVREQSGYKMSKVKLADGRFYYSQWGPGHIDGLGFDGDKESFVRDLGIMRLFGIL